MANTHRLVGSRTTRVLALHGWFGSAAGWGWLPAAVDRERFSYAFMDCRGYGDSRDVDGQHTMAEWALDAVTLADELGWSRFSLLGHSMGGMAVQRVLLEAPDRVDRLVGLNPVPANGIPFDEQGWALFSGAPEEIPRSAMRSSTSPRATGCRRCWSARSSTTRWSTRPERHSRRT